MKTKKNNSKASLRLALQIACKEMDLPTRQEFHSWATVALANHFKEKLELCIRIVEPKESKELNFRYRGKNKPTNVLSFSYDEHQEAGATKLLGDLVLCAELIKQEALTQSKALQAHWAHLTIHGVLHLLGYDHQTTAQAKTMETLEIAILQQLNFNNPYLVRK
ncbi:MAG: rRNA maturation RNase YbeY [Gammaproteobacteria bacterium RIFCSPHIGHO2_12_FULL_35_23]|nr:MAG: rRNA maturation RNase YbeY [Gammaproteobacteria bacterium RIFCSPHIGHO2_12_FULL_35_23]